MAFEKPIMTAPADIITDDEGNVVRIVEHYRQGDYHYDIVSDAQGDIQIMRYSTLSIKRELAKLGKWDAAKALIERSGAWDDYILANYLAESDPVFVAAKTKFVSEGILTADELAELLPKCIWTAE